MVVIIALIYRYQQIITLQRYPSVARLPNGNIFILGGLVIPTFAARPNLEIQKPGVATNVLVNSPVLAKGGSTDWPKVITTILI